ncbi:hypothetical protein [Streptomyces massasporeus]|uniref:hypothetical protein n=1 Tax=Streptomyces massasporeus TaxID=67324 RepID=UPI00369D3D47
MSPLARWCHRHRLAVVLAWVGLLIALGGAVGAAGSSFGDSPLSPDTDSARATALLQYQQPELDIVSYFPAVVPATLGAIDAASARVLAEGMTGPDPVFLSTLKADRDAFTARHAKVTADADGARILRSVLMKPEAEDHVHRLHERVTRLARS